MKTITLVALIFFILTVSGIFVLSLLDIDADKNINRQINNKISLTAQEVAKHSAPEDCYLIVNQKVYDVSSFVNQHPGDRRNIEGNCGREVTGLFASIHSNFAWDLLKKYEIGNLITPQ
ncbi:MAG: cytochrome b5-like heme/steroid binding domain-containing protein [Candidatus Buchananbacteria bacterium]|nr:cytochrome b5-like heme/steroid binding domain-containing protein [Candidatus Buchananbacteria bacterium]